MKKGKLITCLLLFIFICTYSFGQGGVQKIVILRHGEKPDEGENLSCAGWNRAMQLSQVLYKKFGLPNQIYIPSLHTGKKTTVARMYQTIVPFAIKYNLNLNTKFNVQDIDKLSAQIKQQSGTTLLVWEHKNIHKIAAAFGIKEKLSWDNDDFDSIWIITITNGVPKLVKDKEGITPSANCGCIN